MWRFCNSVHNHVVLPYLSLEIIWILSHCHHGLRYRTDDLEISIILPFSSLIYLFNSASQLRTNSYLQWRPNPPLTQTMLGQLCTALWDSRSRPVVIQLGIEPGSVVTDASSTEMQCLRPLRHIGALIWSLLNCWGFFCTAGSVFEFKKASNLNEKCINPYKNVNLL